jgi:hypothetical protein
MKSSIRSAPKRVEAASMAAAPNALKATLAAEIAFGGTPPRASQAASDRIDALPRASTGRRRSAFWLICP